MAPSESAPRGPAAPPGNPGHARAAPAGAESGYALPARADTQQFSGSSAPPPNGRTGARRGERHRPASRHRNWDLDEGQIEAQWINPPVGAGE